MADLRRQVFDTLQDDEAWRDFIHAIWEVITKGKDSSAEGGPEVEPNPIFKRLNLTCEDHDLFSKYTVDELYGFEAHPDGYRVPRSLLGQYPEDIYSVKSLAYAQHQLGFDSDQVHYSVGSKLDQFNADVCVMSTPADGNPGLIYIPYDLPQEGGYVNLVYFTDEGKIVYHISAGESHIYNFTVDDGVVATVGPQSGKITVEWSDCYPSTTRDVIIDAETDEQRKAADVLKDWIQRSFPTINTEVGYYINVDTPVYFTKFQTSYDISITSNDVYRITDFPACTGVFRDAKFCYRNNPDLYTLDTVKDIQFNGSDVIELRIPAGISTYDRLTIRFTGTHGTAATLVIEYKPITVTWSYTYSGYDIADVTPTVRYANVNYTPVPRIGSEYINQVPLALDPSFTLKFRDLALAGRIPAARTDSDVNPGEYISDLINARVEFNSDSLVDSDGSFSGGFEFVNMTPYNPEDSSQRIAQCKIQSVCRLDESTSRYPDLQITDNTDGTFDGLSVFRLSSKEDISVPGTPLANLYYFRQYNAADREAFRFHTNLIGVELANPVSAFPSKSIHFDTDGEPLIDGTLNNPQAIDTNSALDWHYYWVGHRILDEHMKSVSLSDVKSITINVGSEAPVKALLFLGCKFNPNGWRLIVDDNLEFLDLSYSENISCIEKRLWGNFPKIIRCLGIDDIEIREFAIRVYATSSSRYRIEDKCIIRVD